MASKKMKYASMAGVGLLTMSLVACGTEQQQPVTLGDQMSQSGIKKIEDSPLKDKCREYELQKDGSYKCDPVDDDNGSSGGGMAFVPFWFFNGHTYSSHSAMVNSSDYKANNLVSGTKNSFAKSNSSSKSSSSTSKSGSSSSSSSGSKTGGFGSGGKGTSGGS